MHRRQLGPFEVSALGLGCMNMSMGYGSADDKESSQLLQAALDNGYNFLDTASMYGTGHNEALIGRSLAHRRHEFILASKCGILKNERGGNEINGQPEMIKHTCEESLKRLQTDVIDLYYLHRPDPNIAIEESVGALSDLVSEGKIRTIGLSEVSTETLKRAHATHPITALQSEYSLWARTPERKILQACRELDIAFVPFSPLGRGFFTGKARDVSHLTETDLRVTIARPRFEPEAFAINSKLLKPFAAVAQQQGCSMGQLALAWLLAKEDSTLIPIPGTKHMAYMVENAKAGDLKLSTEVVSNLDSLINEDNVMGERYSAGVMAASDAEND